MTKKELVSICWAYGPADANGDYAIAFLAFNNGGGAIRTYERDDYDGRLPAGLPFFATARDLFAWFDAGNVGHDKPCQIPAELAQRIDAS